jgi:5-methylcytosine-specific restriction enzyme subunit McrC
MTLRTLRLTEYRPREVRLRRVDVDALLATRGAIEITPTCQRHRYRITAQGVAGVLLTPNLRVVIRPKIPKANLFLLLDPDAPPDLLTDMSEDEPGSEAIDFLARRLADVMRARGAAGLHRGYVETSDRQPFLQGRLDVAAQARESASGRTKFHVTRDEFCADTAMHRLTKATAEAVVSSQLISPAVRYALRLAISAYADVTSLPLDLAALDSLTAEADRPLVDLCRLLARGLQPGELAGEIAGPAFLLDMERVFERYVERGLQANLPTDTLEAQREFVYHSPVPPGQPSLIGRPDLVIRRDGKVRSILDAKWKSLDGPPPAPDVHQAIAYAAALGCRDVRLVYPGRRWTSWNYDLVGPTTLSIHTLRVVGRRDACQQSLEQLARQMGCD